ncbi:MAG: 2-C-methyl-D-erythritol 4-phosphate cytidylyltransferase [Cyclobacteriaceae bacterium]
MTQKEYALVVAGGKGARFGSALPKQFLELNGKPILLHTLDAFYRYSSQVEIILVLPEDQIFAWGDLAKKYSFNRTLTIQPGGLSRFQSVRKGLEKIPGEGLVAIHDGVRPMVTSDLIAASFRIAALHHSAICAVPLKESLRKIDGTVAQKNGGEEQNTKAVDRSAFRLIQTPQTFQVGLIKDAYKVPELDDATDDATVFERAGHKIFLFEGRYDNIKITTPEDLIVAEALLRHRL